MLQVNKILFTCNFRKGLTIAQYRSADSAVSVKTDTPIETSFADSVIRHNIAPHGHDSNVYTIDASGTQIKITNRSASANEKIYLVIIRKAIKTFPYFSHN